MDLDLADFGMNFALDQCASYSEARAITGTRTAFFIRNGDVLSGSKLPWEGIGFRVLLNGGLGFCSVDQPTQDNIRNAVKTALQMAKISNPKEKIDFGEPICNEAKWGIDYKQDLKDVNNETIISLIKELDNTADRHEISSRTYIFETQRCDKYIVTSEGSKIHADLSMLKLFSILTAKGLLDTEQRWVDFTRCTGWEGTKPWIEDFEKECVMLSKVTKKSEKGLQRGDVVDFVVSPEIAGIIAHENAGHPSEGDRIMGREGAQAGESHWRDLEIGKSRVGSTHVTIEEDPTVPGTGGYYLYDDECVKARKRTLIKEGIINEPLLNREYGVKFGLGTNASSRSTNYNREPIIRMANTYFAPGDFSQEELIEDVKKGVYMLSFTEWNIDDRRFQSKYVGQECYLIENGEISDQMIRRPVLETTTIGLFSSVDGVSKELNFAFPGICGKSDPGQGVPVYAGGGYLRLRNVRVG